MKGFMTPHGGFRDCIGHPEVDEAIWLEARRLPPINTDVERSLLCP